MRNILSRVSPRNIKVLTNREKWTTLFKQGFIGGLIDSDGHVYLNKKRTRPSRVLFKTTNEKLRDDVAKILYSLGIQAATHTAKPYEGSYSNNPRCILCIPSAELKKIIHRIPAVKLERYERE